jgi:alpha-beta hydrolase superfamily lysophospholipase
VQFGNPSDVADHREVPVHFTCEGNALAGTIYLPLKEGRHPAVVWLHGSGEQARLTYGPLVAAYINDGIAFFTYDKRGVGESLTGSPRETIRRSPKPFKRFSRIRLIA